MNPAATANPLRAVGGTGADDLWLVGDVGTLLHWDGSRATVARAGAPADSFVAVAATARDDVWVAGRSSVGTLLHWDGTSWSSAYAIAAQPIHALAASGSGVVYAAADDNGQGQLWQYSPTGGWYNLTFYFDGNPILRDVVAFSAGASADGDTLFAVGDAGIVRWGPPWKLAGGTPSAGGGATADPFGADKNYFGVWGASASDVWAAFMSGTSVGFSHFDGHAWSVAQTLPVHCFSSPLGDTRADRGKRLVGLDADHILATLGPGLSCNPFEWNGTTWVERPPTTTPLVDPSLTAVGGRWYTVTATGLFAVSNSDYSWSELPGPTARDGLQSVSVAGDAVWSTRGFISVGNAQPRVWRDGGWQVATTSATDANSEVLDAWALAADDVWVAGTAGNGGQGIVLHWDGSAWSPPVVLPGSSMATSIWADRADDVWVAGRGAPASEYGDSCVVYHFDGTSWTSVPVPPHPLGAVRPAIGGLRADAVWITSFIGSPAPSDRRVVWKWDGQSIQEVDSAPSEFAYGELEPFGHPWAASDDDVWIPGQPILHWHGGSWSTSATPSPDVAINAIYGTAPDDVWGVGSGPFGGAIWHLENGRFVSVLDVGARLFGIAGGDNALPWVVGDNGATLRLVDDSRVP